LDEEKFRLRFFSLGVSPIREARERIEYFRGESMLKRIKKLLIRNKSVRKLCTCRR